MSPEVMRKIAKPMLFVAAVIWGASFFIMKNTLDSIPVNALLAMRFTTGAVLMGIICIRKWKDFTIDYLWRGAIIGGFLFCAYTVQTFGLTFTTPSKNAFLTSVYCVLVPFFTWAVVKRRPDKFNMIAAVLCVTGVGLVSLNEELSINIGDLLTLVCAVLFAGHITAVEKLSPGKDIYLITLFQFAFSALYSWVATLTTEVFPTQALRDPDVILPLAYLCVMATTVALLFQNVGQVWSDPASTAVILSLESVFGVLFSVLFYGDKLNGQMLCGFALIFVAVVCSETKFSFLRKKV